MTNVPIFTEDWDMLMYVIKKPQTESLVNTLDNPDIKQLLLDRDNQIANLQKENEELKSKIKQIRELSTL